jgi:hypothetical protein
MVLTEQNGTNGEKGDKGDIEFVPTFRGQVCYSSVEYTTQEVWIGDVSTLGRVLLRHFQVLRKTTYSKVTVDAKG